jgi:hypothetical protein
MPANEILQAGNGRRRQRRRGDDSPEFAPIRQQRADAGHHGVRGLSNPNHKEGRILGKIDGPVFATQG